ncbi:MAG: aminoacyl-tRNA hydrolase, partial [Actinomycetes bacterium]
ETARHRHNVGLLLVDHLAGAGTRVRAHTRARALTWEGRVGGRRVVLVKPTTYMNDAGQAVSPLCAFYKVTTDQVVAVHDELDLPFGSMRLKYGGGDNGHNGLKSLRRSLGTGDFFRARLGIGRPPGRMDPAAFVLRDFSATERAEVPQLVERAADAVSALIDEGLERAQSQYND